MRAQQLLTRLIEWLPDPILLIAGELMRTCMMFIGGLFFYLTYTGEFQKLTLHLWDNGLHSEPIAFFLAGILAMYAAQMLIFKRAYEGCRETLAVKRYLRTGKLPYYF